MNRNKAYDGIDCGDETCKKCCPHDEFEHDTCMNCGYERDPGIAIDHVMNTRED